MKYIGHLQANHFGKHLSGRGSILLCNPESLYVRHVPISNVNVRSRNFSSVPTEQEICAYRLMFTY